MITSGLRVIAIALCITGAVAVVTADPPTETARLTIRVINLRSHNGQLIFGVFQTGKGFPSSEKNAVNWQVRSIDKDEIIFTAEVPPGEYAASVLHDENANNKMDTNLFGVPTEGYGVTNNPKPRFRQAKFNEASFSLPAEGAEMTISVQYF